MIGYQEKCLKQIEKAITSHNSHLTQRKLEMVTAFDYANTGYFYAQPDNSFEPILEGRFDFQRDRATIKMSSGRSYPAQDFYFEYKDSHGKFNELEKWILQVIRGWVQGEMRRLGQKPINS